MLKDTDNVLDYKFLSSVFRREADKGRGKRSQAMSDIITSLQTTGEVPRGNGYGSLPQEQGYGIDPYSGQPIPLDLLMGTLPPTTAEDPFAEAEGIIGRRGYVTGLPAPPGGQTSYNQVQYVEEEEWSKEFTAKNNRPPTFEEWREWLSKNISSDWHFTENSVSYQLGFKTLAEYGEAQKYGETYGPWAGSKVPEGGTVLLDAKGNPWIRTWKPERWGDRFEAVPTGNKEHYPAYGAPPSMPDNPNDILAGTYSNEWIYEAKLIDYFTSLVERDAPQIEAIIEDYNQRYDAIEDQLYNNELSKEQADDAKSQLNEWYDAQVKALWTPERSQAELADIQKQLIKGTPANELPYFNELGDILGPETSKLLQEAIDNFNQTKQEYESSIPKWGGYQQPEVAPVETGDEERQYYSWINTLDTAPQWKRWLVQRFDEYLYRWQQTGMSVPFLDWVRGFLAG